MDEYQPLTFKTALGLAAPHAWMASICPVILGALLSYSLEGELSFLLFGALLAAALLMHCSVNTLNDYYDYIKGTDSTDNSDDPSDAVLVYNRLNPLSVRNIGFAYLALAALFGGYAVCVGGVLPLIFGAIGCFVVLTYSGGKKPISFMPLGEIISGLVMGGFITLAVFSAFTGYVDARVVYMSMPLVIGIGLLMMTNNICDIERDLESGRVTLPIILGFRSSRLLYRVLVALWMIIMIQIVVTWFAGGTLVIALAAALLAPALLRVSRLPLQPDVRGFCLGSILKLNIGAHCAYLAAILAHTLLV